MLGHCLFSRFLNLYHIHHSLQVCYLWKMSLDLRFVLNILLNAWILISSRGCRYLSFSAQVNLYAYLFCPFFSLWLQTSDTHTKMIDILAKTNFVVQEFILSPLQFGIPYSRPRYFCLVLSLSLLARILLIRAFYFHLLFFSPCFFKIVS